MQPSTSFRFSALLDALPPVPRASGRGPYAGGPYAGALDLLVAPAEWALAATGRLLCAAARELHRAYRARAADEFASVLGAPTSAAVAAAWTPAPRALRDILVLGSRLVDASAAHPIATLRSADGKSIAGRSGGLRPWFRNALPDLPYSTAMRYRQLARRLRQALGIPPALPLEWLLSDTPPATLTQDAALLPLISPLRRRLAAFLAPHRTQAALSRALADRLGIARCPFAPRSRRRTPGQKARDLAEDAALMNHYLARLETALRSNRPLAPPERRALARLRDIGYPIDIPPPKR